MRYFHLIFVCTLCVAGPAARCASAQAQSAAAVADSLQQQARLLGDAIAFFSLSNKTVSVVGHAGNLQITNQA